MKIALAAGLTAFVVAFFAVSASGTEESERAGFALGASVLAAVVVVALALVWEWAV